MRRWILPVLAGAVVFACGNGESTPPPDVPPGIDAGETDSSSTTNDAATDGSADAGANNDSGNPPIDSGSDSGPPCGLATIDIAPGTSNTLRGTLTMPTAVPREHVLLAISTMLTSGYAYETSVNGTPGKTSDTYTFEAPAPGPNGYWLKVYALTTYPGFDENDYVGFYGANAAVLVNPWDGVKITPSTAKCGLDIKVGKPICFKNWSTACTKDAECRRTICECNNGLQTTLAYCNPQTNFCEHAPTLVCATECGGAGNVKFDREATCFNN